MTRGYLVGLIRKGGGGTDNVGNSRKSSRKAKGGVGMTGMTIQWEGESLGRSDKVSGADRSRIRAVGIVPKQGYAKKDRSIPTSKNKFSKSPSRVEQRRQEAGKGGQANQQQHGREKYNGVFAEA